MVNKQLLWISSLVCLSAACATAQAASSVSLRDARPDDEKKTHFHSLLITSCNYGVRRIGDADIAPAPIEQLRTALGEAFGERLMGKEVTVLHFTVDSNTAEKLRQQAGQMYTGLIPHLMLSTGAKCPREKMEAGWYSAEDITTLNSPLIVEVELQVDGQSVAVHQVYSPPDPLETRVWKPKSHEQVNAAISAAQTRLIAALESMLPKPVGSGTPNEPPAEPNANAGNPPN